jgi:hypothetical protein
MKDIDRKALIGSCEELEETVKAAGIRVKGDYRDNYSPGWKFNHWELKVRNSSSWFSSLYAFHNVNRGMMGPCHLPLEDFCCLGCNSV